MLLHDTTLIKSNILSTLEMFYVVFFTTVSFMSGFGSLCSNCLCLQWGNMAVNSNNFARAVIVDHLIALSAKCGIKSQTLFYCVDLLDAFSSSETVSPDHLQLLFYASMDIALKFDNQESLSHRRFLTTISTLFPPRLMHIAECKILNVLAGKLIFPNGPELLQDRGLNGFTYLSSLYFLESVLPFSHIQQFPITERVDCSVWLSCKIFKSPDYDKCESINKQCAEYMLAVVAHSQYAGCEFKAARYKFACESCQNISIEVGEQLKGLTN